jgi:hypothetical protein
MGGLFWCWEWWCVLSIYIISLVLSLRWWSSSFPSIHPVIRFVIHPSKFLIPEEEDDGRGGGGQMATTIVYPNGYI